VRRGLAACDKNICELRERAPPTPFDTIEYWGIAVLRALFTSLAANRSLRAVAERSSLGRKLSSRFVAGTQPDDVLRATQIVNQSGIRVSIDDLGENVSTTEEARASAQLYHQLLDEIAARRLDANISLKLTHMGLDIDEALAHELVASLIAKAVRMTPPNFVRVDMEGSAYTDRTLALVRALHRQPDNPGRVGAVIQSYLRRSEADVVRLLSEGIRIRLCKGAYNEPAEIALQKKSDVDANYLKLMKLLLKSGTYHGLATHDENIIREVKKFADQENISPDAFEFQMLYGVRRDLQQSLVREGWRMRVYIPFGAAWYPYLMRRLAERPANVIFIAKNLLRK
jgi:proline dehydrogenase